MRVAALSTSFLALLASAAALGRPEIKGSKFFLDGEQFFFKGIAYQPEKGDPNPAQADPLADAVGCKRDVEVFKGLGINSIRVYQTDPAQNHDECMKLLSDAGIYVVLDLASSQKAINRADPQWDTDLYNYYLSKVDAFAGYDNVAAFLVGNEVANSVATVNSAEYVKAAARDVKAYIKQKKLSIPIGYASNDEPEIRDDLREYFDCGSDD
ncbi:1 3-beta-glucanosyltransferase gel4, partial [Spiromyces aspiralis]